MNLQTLISKQISILRTIDRIINSKEFEHFYNQTDDKEYINTIIANYDKDALILWLKSNRAKNLYTMPLGQLRKIARNNYIQNWHSLPRESLINQIEEPMKIGN